MSPDNPLLSLASALGSDLYWIAFLPEGRPPRIIRPRTSDVGCSDAAIADRLALLSSVTAELCQAGQGALVLIHDNRSYVILCDGVAPWLILNVSTAVTIERLRELFNPGAGIYQNGQAGDIGPARDASSLT